MYEVNNMKKYYELQPLRLQGGWKIEFNNFTEYDICTQSKSEIISNIEKWVCYGFFSKYL